jgi:hypothetical protein
MIDHPPSGSQRRPAHVFLENLQRQVYESLGDWAESELSRGDQQAGKRSLEKHAQRLRANGASEEEISMIMEKLRDTPDALPSRFEDPNAYAIMLSLEREIRDAAAEFSNELPSNIVLGTLPTGQVNAITVKVPDSEDYLVLFESQLFTFCLLMSKAITGALLTEEKEGKFFKFSTDEEHWKSMIASRPVIRERFYEVLVAYLVTGRPANAKPYFVPKNHEVIVSSLLTPMELFILGHEYGHVIGGHLEHSQLAKRMISSIEVDLTLQNWEQEFQADALGLQLALSASIKEGYDIGLSYWGADFFFKCVQLVERGLAILTDNTVGGSDTHPPSSERQKALRRSLSERLGEQQARGPLHLADTIDRLSDYLMTTVESQLTELKARKIQVAPSWRV